MFPNYKCNGKNKETRDFTAVLDLISNIFLHEWLSQHNVCQIMSAKLWSQRYVCGLASQKAWLIVSRLSISVLVQSVNYADWFMCLKPLEEIRRVLLEYKWQFMLRSLMGQRECVFHAFHFFLWEWVCGGGVGSESRASQTQIKWIPCSPHSTVHGHIQHLLWEYR